MSLEALRRAVGAVPRGDAEVLPTRPAELEKTELGKVWNHALLTWREGTPVLGWVLMANTLLWNGEISLAPADVLYTFDPVYGERPHLLQRIAHELFRYHDHGPDVPLPRTPWVRRARNLILTGHAVMRHERVPTAITRGPVVYMATVVVSTDALPGDRLTSSLLPLVVERREQGSALVVPSPYWPVSIKAAWGA